MGRIIIFASSCAVSINVAACDMVLAIEPTPSLAGQQSTQKKVLYGQLEADKVLNERACKLIAERKFLDALELLHQAFPIAKKRGSRIRQSTILRNMAVSYKGIGKFDYERICIKRAEELLGPPEGVTVISQPKYVIVPQYIQTPPTTRTILFGSSTPDREWFWRSHFQDREHGFARDMGHESRTDNYTNSANLELMRHDAALDSMQQSQFAQGRTQAERACHGSSYMSRYNNSFGH